MAHIFQYFICLCSETLKHVRNVLLAVLLCFAGSLALLLLVCLHLTFVVFSLSFLCSFSVLSHYGNDISTIMWSVTLDQTWLNQPPSPNHIDCEGVIYLFGIIRVSSLSQQKSAGISTCVAVGLFEGFGLENSSPLSCMKYKVLLLDLSVINIM